MAAVDVSMLHRIRQCTNAQAPRAQVPTLSAWCSLKIGLLPISFSQLGIAVLCSMDISMTSAS